jgi:uncharacterized membrane protein
MKVKVIVELIVIFAVLAIPAEVYAAGFGLAPSFIDLKDLTRGQSVERSVKIYNNQNQPLELYPDTGEYSDWVTVLNPDGGEIKSINVPPNGSATVILKITVPATAANGEYEIPVYFGTKPPEEGTGIGVQAPVKVFLIVTGQQRISVKVMSYEVSDTEVGVPARLSITVMNDGNVIAQPEFKIKISKDGSEIFENKTKVKIPPREIEEIKLSWDTSNAQKGNYSVMLTVDLDGETVYSHEVAFKVFEKGTLTASLYLVNASLNKYLEVGKTGKFEVFVKNTGYIDYEAKLRVEVYRDDEFLSVVQSDSVWLEKGNMAPLTAYLLFDEKGEYTLKPVVVYAGKLAILNEAFVKVGVGTKTQENSEEKVAVKARGFEAFALLTVVIVLMTILWLKRR